MTQRSGFEPYSKFEMQKCYISCIQFEFWSVVILFLSTSFNSGTILTQSTSSVVWKVPPPPTPTHRVSSWTPFNSQQPLLILNISNFPTGALISRPLRSLGWKAERLRVFGGWGLKTLFCWTLLWIVRASLHHEDRLTSDRSAEGVGIEL